MTSKRQGGQHRIHIGSTLEDRMAIVCAQWDSVEIRTNEGGFRVVGKDRFGVRHRTSGLRHTLMDALADVAGASPGAA